MIIVLLGAPGAGKGTQAQKLVSEVGFQHVSTGDLLRSAVKEGSELGKKAQGYMQAGELVPDSLVIDLVMERLKDPKTNGFILDGFPRNIAQAEALDAALADMGQRIDAALLVHVANEVIIDRLSSRRTCRSCGYTAPFGVDVCPRCEGEMYQRPDDNPETVRQRLNVYENQTAPLIDYYKEHASLLKVDGNRPVDEVYADVKKQLNL